MHNVMFMFDIIYHLPGNNGEQIWRRNANILMFSCVQFFGAQGNLRFPAVCVYVYDAPLTLVGNLISHLSAACGMSGAQIFNKPWSTALATRVAYYLIAKVQTVDFIVGNRKKHAFTVCLVI